MKTKYAAALLLAAALPACAASVYTCTDSKGRTTYTSTPAPGANCAKSDLGRPAIYSSLPPAPSSYQSAQTYEEQPSVATLGASQQSTASQEQIAAARRRLSDAKKALEEGKKIRYGNERNYAKYQARIADLENAVKQAEADLAKLLGSGSDISAH